VVDFDQNEETAKELVRVEMIEHLDEEHVDETTN
jgi:hypothetical protein